MDAQTTVAAGEVRCSTRAGCPRRQRLALRRPALLTGHDPRRIVFLFQKPGLVDRPG
jgi:hypothetical protein